MARRQLRTKDYPDAARKRLGELVEQARRAAGFRYRTDFCRAHGIKNLRGLELLESGQPGVGQASLFEIARALPGWDEDTPRLILEGGDPPPVSEHLSSTAPGPVAPRTDNAIPEPEPQDYPDAMEYLNAQYWYMREGLGWSHEAVMRGFNMAAAIYTRRQAERDEPSAHGDELGRSS